MRQDEPPNELLDYLRALEPSALTELTSSAGNDVAGVMDAFVQRLMGTRDKEHLRRAESECNAQELGKLMFWLMVVGYTLRSMEARFDMDRSLDLPTGGASGPAAPGLPPGRL